MVALAAPFIAIGPAAANVGMSPLPSFPDPVTVGQTFTGRLNVTNVSTPPDTDAPGVITDIILVPACTQGVFPANNCTGGVDPGVFAIGPTSTATASCAGVPAGQPITEPFVPTTTIT